MGISGREWLCEMVHVCTREVVYADIMDGLHYTPNLLY